jgi:hypothetical protein
LDRGNAYSYTYTYTHTNSYSDCDAYSYADCNRDSHCHCYDNYDLYPDVDGHANSYIDTNGNPGAESYSQSEV